MTTIKKISDEEIEIVSETKVTISKEKLLKDKAEIDTLLAEFEK